MLFGGHNLETNKGRLLYMSKCTKTSPWQNSMLPSAGDEREALLPCTLMRHACIPLHFPSSPAGGHQNLSH